MSTMKHTSVDGEQNSIEKKTLPYGKDSRQCVDIYLPSKQSSSNPVPLLIYIHGGAWVSESTEMYSDLANALASKGIAVALPEYRLTRYKNIDESDPNTIWHPDHLNDVYAGLQLIFQQANKFGYSTNHTVVVGHSAGAWMNFAIAFESENITEIQDSKNLIRDFPKVDPKICKSIKAFVCVESIFSLYDMLQQYPSYDYFTKPTFYPPQSQEAVKKPYYELKKAGPESWPIRPAGSYHPNSPDQPNIFVIHSTEDTLLDDKYDRKGTDLLKSKGLRVHIDTHSFKGDHEDLLHTQAFWNRLIEIVKL